MSIEINGFWVFGRGRKVKIEEEIPVGQSWNTKLVEQTHDFLSIPPKRKGKGIKMNFEEEKEKNRMKRK